MQQWNGVLSVFGCVCVWGGGGWIGGGSGVCQQKCHLLLSDGRSPGCGCGCECLARQSPDKPPLTAPLSSKKCRAPERARSRDISATCRHRFAVCLLSSCLLLLVRPLLPATRHTSSSSHRLHLTACMPPNTHYCSVLRAGWVVLKWR